MNIELILVETQAWSLDVLAMHHEPRNVTARPYPSHKDTDDFFL